MPLAIFHDDEYSSGSSIGEGGLEQPLCGGLHFSHIIVSLFLIFVEVTLVGKRHLGQKER